MNILVFLTPKSHCEFIYDDFSIRQTLEKLEHYHYSAVPIINKEGIYVGTIKEGDLLWFIKDQCDLNYKEAEKISISNVKRRKDNIAINSRQSIDDLLGLALDQNFIPVVDDSNHFIGIVTRKKIIEYFEKKNHKKIS